MNINPFALSNLLFEKLNQNKNIDMINIGIIKVNCNEVIFNGFINAENPITINKLNIADPIMFPIAMSYFFFFEAIRDTLSSGKVVPIATIVAAMIVML